VAVDPDLYSYDVEEEDDGFAVEEESNVEFASKLIDEKKKYFEEQHASLVPLRKTVSEPSNELLSLEYHRQIANESRAHREDYLQRLMHKSELICQKIIESNPENQKRYQESKRRVENNREFINSLYTTYHPKVNFTFGTFLLNLTRSYLEGKYLLVYIHSIAPETEDNLKRLLEFVLQQKRIANVVNRNCIVYGMFDNSDDYEILQKYIPLKSLPAFALFRLSKSKKAEEFISAYVRPATLRPSPRSSSSSSGSPPAPGWPSRRRRHMASTSKRRRRSSRSWNSSRTRRGGRPSGCWQKQPSSRRSNRSTRPSTTIGSSRTNSTRPSSRATSRSASSPRTRRKGSVRTRRVSY
jgi:hypothetical protein